MQATFEIRANTKARGSRKGAAVVSRGAKNYENIKIRQINKQNTATTSTRRTKKD